MLVNKDVMNERMNELVTEKINGMVRYSKEHDLDAVYMCTDQLRGLVDGAYCYGEFNLYESFDLRHMVTNTMNRIWEEFN